MLTLPADRSWSGIGPAKATAFRSKSCDKDWMKKNVFQLVIDTKKNTRLIQHMAYKKYLIALHVSPLLVKLPLIVLCHFIAVSIKREGESSAFCDVNLNRKDSRHKSWFQL